MGRILLVLLALALPAPASAQGKAMVLVADGRLQDSGLLDHLAPRFGLKHGIRVTIIPSGRADLRGLVPGADAVLTDRALGRALAEEGLTAAPRPVFNSAGAETYVLLVVPGAENEAHAGRFSDWLLSEVGRRTVTGFEGPVRYDTGAGKAVAKEVQLPEGDTAEGMKLSTFHCGRCHVVDQANRFGGTGSAPSFAAMRSMEDWEAKFLNFWDAPPHPSFTQVDGVTEPFDPLRPPHIAPVEMTLDELAAIVAFAASVAPIDLGAPVQSR